MLKKNQTQQQQPQQLNHVMQRAFSSPLEAIFGSEISLPPPPPRRKRKHEDDDDGPSNIPIVLQNEIAQLRKCFKVSLDPCALPASSAGAAGAGLVCKLEDSSLPSVPAVSVTVPASYPDSPPVVSDRSELAADYSATPFLLRVQDAFSARLSRLPARFTLSQMLNSWEMSVRAACSPRGLTKVTTDTVLLGI